MSISPPSDLILDVVKAADPDALKTATAKLRTIARAAHTDAAAFAGELEQVWDGPVPAIGPSSGLNGQRVAMLNRTALAGDSVSPAQKFEAFVLQQFVESMMPEKSEAVFGEGTAGSIWKSMLAEQIGNQIASAGGIGIAKMLTVASRENR